jgi:DUF1680 family protein
MRTRSAKAALLVIAASCASVFAAGRGLVDTSSSPHVKVRSVGLSDVRWTDGFWAAKWQLCRAAMIPAVQQALLDERNSEQLASFRIAAGLEQGKYHGTDWSDGDCYKWLEAVSLAYGQTKDPALDRLLDEWIAVIGKAQRPDGFISTNVQLRPDRQPLDIPYTHQLYNMGHLLTAACIHHRTTGKDSFLLIARKAADYLDRQFRPRPPRLVHFPWNPSAYMGLVELYRTTGESRYLELAGIMIGNRGSSPGGGDHRNGGTDQTQDRVPLRSETEAVGHAVCAMYLYCGAADLCAETGEPALLDSLERIWRNVTGRKMYITGAVGTGSGQSSRGDPVHEAFLGDYELPSAAYAETCANIANAMWNFRMLEATGQAKYADVMETVLYNSMLSAVAVDGKAFSYCNPLAWDGKEGQGHLDGRRWAIHSCYCCPPQVARTIAGLHGWAYGVSADAVWVHLYGGSKLETQLPGGQAVSLTQQTDYPWAGRVKITIDAAPAGAMSLMLRIPGWARSAHLSVNGREVPDAPRPGSYAAIRRTWSRGDVIELDLPMEVRLMEAHPAVKELRGKVAVTRGPIVYCLEAPADEGGEKLWKAGVFLPVSASFTARHRSDFLGGITVLDVTAVTFAGKDRLARQSAATRAASPLPPDRPELYRPFQPQSTTAPRDGTTAVTLIPYFAWANRGLSWMEVWIPLAR